MRERTMRGRRGAGRAVWIGLIALNVLLLTWTTVSAQRADVRSYDCCQGNAGELFCCYDCCVIPSDCDECRVGG